MKDETTQRAEAAREEEISPSEFLLSGRRRTLRLFQEGRIQEAGRHIKLIQRVFRLEDNFINRNQQGGFYGNRS